MSAESEYVLLRPDAGLYSPTLPLKASLYQILPAWSAVIRWGCAVVTWCSTILTFPEEDRYKASNTSHPLTIFRKPDIPLRISGDPIGIAFRCWNCVLNEGVRMRVEEANAACFELGKPEISRGIKGQVKGSTPFQHIPLAPGHALQIKFSDCIAIGLSEPDMAMHINSQEDGVRIPRRLPE